jgi:hypothetical protein
MTATTFSLATVTGLAAIGALVLTAIGYAGFQRRRDRRAAIRETFDQVVATLASDNETSRLAAAILLRRFFDENSELGIFNLRPGEWRRTAPYAQEAISVIAAVLRGVETGNFQKLLADGLAFAPDLRGADLQRANLQNAYLGPHRKTTTLVRADFYRAVVSGASFRNAAASGCVFYQARLVGTVFKGADLQSANFDGADLSDTQFHGALLHGASFRGAIHVPVEVAMHIDQDAIYSSAEPVGGAPTSDARATPRRVYFSLPNERTDHEDMILDKVKRTLEDEGLVPEIHPPSEYPTSGQISEVRRRLSSCCGAVIFGFDDSKSSVDLRMQHGDSEAPHELRQPTPWNHLEAGLAFALDLPLLVLLGAHGKRGIFDEAISENAISYLPLDELASASSDTKLRNWLLNLK